MAGLGISGRGQKTAEQGYMQRQGATQRNGDGNGNVRRSERDKGSIIQYNRRLWFPTVDDGEFVVVPV